MTERFRRQMRLRLERRNDALLEAHRHTRAREDEILVLPGEPMDASDRATAREEAELLARLDDAEVVELRAIASSMARLDAGTYGTCVGCAHGIALGRLRALADTPLCIACAVAYERRFHPHAEGASR